MKRIIGLLLAIMLCAACLAEGAGRELSGYFGGDIAQAATELGGLTYEPGEEFADNYIGEMVALHGNDGKVCFIALRAENRADTLCGIKNGMKREDAQSLMNGCPQLWDYPEELAWIVRADAANELNDEILVVFFDENGIVNGAWYRNSNA